MRLSPRLVAFVIMSSRRTVLLRSDRAAGAAALPLTTISRLLKSCATPPVIWPIASSRWACRNAAFRGLAALGFVVKAARALQSDADDEQDEQRRRQAEDQMARHGREPLGLDRRGGDAGHA